MEDSEPAVGLTNLVWNATVDRNWRSISGQKLAADPIHLEGVCLTGGIQKLLKVIE